MNIHDLMLMDVELIDLDTPLRDAVQGVRNADIGALPVGENDPLVAMVADWDIVARGVTSDHAPSECTIREVMSEDVYYCFDDEDAHRASDAMAKHKVSRLPVLNREKRLVGIVAMAKSLAWRHGVGRTEASVREHARPESANVPAGRVRRAHTPLLTPPARNPKGDPRWKRSGSGFSSS